MIIKPPIRTQDNHGAGHFGAPRGNHTHRGVDLACYKGSTVLSLTDGVVTKIGYPYNPSDPDKGHLRYVQVTQDEVDYRYFYVESFFQVGDIVSAGSALGITQGLCDIYEGITDHFHFEVKYNGNYIDPERFV